MKIYLIQDKLTGLYMAPGKWAPWVSHATVFEDREVAERKAKAIPFECEVVEMDKKQWESEG